jgi:hypothetical protein
MIDIKLKELNVKNKIIGITLTEEQIIRTILLSDNFHLLKILSDATQIVIFTRVDLSDFLQKALAKKDFHNVMIIGFKNFKEPFPNNFLSFLFKWLNPSINTLRTLYRERSMKRMNSMGLFIRQAIFKLFSSNKFLKRLLRFFYLIFANKRKIYNSFSSFPPFLDTLFVTSLTNTESDLQIGVLYKKLGTSIIATVRSWDNLNSKGVLKLTPDCFVSHSIFMSESAVAFHGLKQQQIKTTVTPAYQEKFKSDRLKNENLEKLSPFKIAYGCIGPYLNPDEINFIGWLAKKSKDLPSIISIIQHPKFKHELKNVDMGNLEVIHFDYLQTTIMDYFTFLSRQNLIISSGTTLSLDTIFVGTPLIALAYEVKEQDYWESHLRSFDYVTHTKLLFEIPEIIKVRGEVDLLKFLSLQIPVSKIDNFHSEIIRLMGDTRLDFIENFLKNC